MSEVKTTTWYSCFVAGSGVLFTEILVEKETERFLVRPNGRREAKRTEYGAWFKTKSEALDYLAERQRRKVQAARDAFEREQKKLSVIVDTEIPA